jgi:hypothetical protein
LVLVAAHAGSIFDNEVVDNTAVSPLFPLPDVLDEAQYVKSLKDWGTLNSIPSSDILNNVWAVVVDVDDEAADSPGSVVTTVVVLVLCCVCHT